MTDSTVNFGVWLTREYVRKCAKNQIMFEEVYQNQEMYEKVCKKNEKMCLNQKCMLKLEKV